MTRLRGGHTMVLAGHGFDGEGPYLSLNDMEARAKVRYHVRGKTFTLTCLPRRMCTGRFDLATHRAEVCPLDVELSPGFKGTVCPACQEATGFNPSFYYAISVSAQQRAFNEQPHYTYLAYFAPGFVKAGISAEARGVRRLLEQGARAARVVGRFPNAYAARELEAALCMQEGICETMRLSKKVNLLAHARFSFADARAALDEAAASIDLTPGAVAGQPAGGGVASDPAPAAGARRPTGDAAPVSRPCASKRSEGVTSHGAPAGSDPVPAPVPAAGAAAATPLDAAMERMGCGEGGRYFDFTRAYFGDASVPACDEMQPADLAAGACAGRCVGMVGGILVLEQGGMHFLAPVKEWESHVVEIDDGEVLHEHAFAPVQMSLL